MECLQSCVSQDYSNREILVLDNASTDGTCEMIEQRFPEARIIRIHRNIGIFPAMNLAVANARGEYVINVDDDAYFLQDNALSLMVDAFENAPMLGAVTCNIEGPHEEPASEEDKLVHIFKLGFTMTPKRAYSEWVGYYPDVLFRDAGEKYMSVALWDAGHPVKLLSSVRMYHARTWTGRSSWGWAFHGLRSQVLVALMRDPTPWVMPHMLLLFIKSFFAYVRRGRFVAWPAAWISAGLHLFDAWKHRKPIRWETQKLLWRLQREGRAQ